MARILILEGNPALLWLPVLNGVEAGRWLEREARTASAPLHEAP